MATAYREQGLLSQAEKEYRAALKYSPDDLKLYLALADTQYHLRRYNDSLGIAAQGAHATRPTIRSSTRRWRTTTPR